eukprot:6178202-Pleurochrysis_carterae.AAC.2
MPIVAPAGEAEFRQEHNLRGWKVAGPVPYRAGSTRWSTSSSRKLCACPGIPRMAINTSTIQCWRVLLTQHLRAVASKRAARSKTRRSTAKTMASALTCAAGCRRRRSTRTASLRRAVDSRQLLKEAHKARHASEQEEEQKHAEPAQQAADKPAEMHGVAARLRIEAKADIDCLT